MGTQKTAAPCEVCGGRCKHSGSDKGFVVGYTVKGISRLVHEHCRSDWKKRKPAIMAGWKELHPEILRGLHPTIRHRIERRLEEQRRLTMPRTRSSEAFNYPQDVRDWLKQRLLIRPRRRGNIRAWFQQLQKERPTWMPKGHSNTDYNDFRALIIEVETRLRQMTSPQAPGPPPAETRALPSVSLGPGEEGELEAMARAAHALIDLAVTRRDRAVVELALEALDQLFHPPKTTG